MNEELQKQFALWLEMLRNGTLSVADFAKEQAPGLIQEILAWGFWSSLCYTVLCTAFLALFLAWLIKGYKKNDGWEGWLDNTDGAVIFPWGICGTISIFASVYVLIIGLPTLIKISVAPRLYLIEYFTNALK